MDNHKEPFQDHEINWKELESIGITKEKLEESGALSTLFNGEKTNPITLELVLLGIDVTMDATLQFVRTESSHTPILEIIGIKPTNIS